MRKSLLCVGLPAALILLVITTSLSAAQVLEITSVAADDSLVDRDIDNENLVVDNDIRLTIVAQDNNGVSAIDAASGVCFITIYDPENNRVVDNQDISSTYSGVDENTGQWYYDFDPSDDSWAGSYTVIINLRYEFDNEDNHQENGLFVGASRLHTRHTGDAKLSRL